MIGIGLKWLTITLIVLFAFSALTMLWALYQLNLGTCAAGCENQQVYRAYVYMGLVGICGFGISALAASYIRRNLD